MTSLAALGSYVPRLSLPASASGDAQPDEVWDRYLRPSRWSEWSPQVQDVECTRRRIARGVTGRVIGPLGVGVDFEVTAFDASRRTWAWHVEGGLAGVTAGLDVEHGVQPYGSGSRTWVTVAGPAPVVLGYLPVAWVALRSLVSP